MKERKRGETALALFFLAFFLVMTIISLTYGPKTRRLPLIIGIPGLVLAVVEVFKGIRGPLSPSRPSGTEGQKGDAIGLSLSDEQKRVLGMIGWVFVLVGMIWVFGFLVTIPLYTLVFMKVRRESWLASLLFAVIGFAVLYLLFIVALNIELYPGLVFEG